MKKKIIALFIACMSLSGMCFAAEIPELAPGTTTDYYRQSDYERNIGNYEIEDIVVEPDDGFSSEQ